MKAPPQGTAPSASTSVLVAIILITGAVWFLQQFGPPEGELPGTLSHEHILRGEWWTVLTHIFMHASFSHLALNMLALTLVGRTVERVYQPRHFAYLYLSSAWAGAALSLLFQPSAYLIGSSAAVLGVVGAYCALRAEENLLAAWSRRLRLRGRNLWVGLVGGCLAAELISRLRGSWEAQGTGHLAHAAGLLMGWAYTIMLQRSQPVETPSDSLDLLMHMLHRHQPAPAEDHPLQRLLASTHAPEPDAPSPPLSDKDFIKQCIDPILDKMVEQGPTSLTPEERAILAEAALRINKQQAPAPKSAPVSDK